MPQPERESRFRKRLREQWPSPCHWTVIESGSTGRGVPDLYGKMPDLPGFWLELKIIEGNRFRSPLTRLQAKWLSDHHAAGGRGYVVASWRRPASARLEAVDQICIWQAALAPVLAERGPTGASALQFDTIAEFSSFLALDLE